MSNITTEDMHLIFLITLSYDSSKNFFEFKQLVSISHSEGILLLLSLLVCSLPASVISFLWGCSPPKE